MDAKAQHGRHRPQDRARGARLVLISGGGEDLRPAQPPLRILGSEPRLRGGFRLTDR